jgi:hypothetical protein
MPGTPASDHVADPALLAQQFAIACGDARMAARVGNAKSTRGRTSSPWQRSAASGKTGGTACPTKQHSRNQSAA